MVEMVGSAGRNRSGRGRVAGVFADRFLDSVHHGRWSAQEHLLGTRRILERWGEAEEVQLAGLLHNAYSTDAFGHAAFALDERGRVSDLIGRPAERLVYLFCTTGRNSLFDVAGSGSGRRRARTRLRVANRVGGAEHVLSTRECRDLLVLHLANIAEQSAAPNGSPAVWLERASRIGSLARRFGVKAPPVFDHCRALVSHESEERLMQAYASALRNCTAVTDEHAEQLLSAAVQAPWVAEPWIWLGLLAIASNDAEQAARFGERAGYTLLDWSTAWDKRLSDLQWFTLTSFLRNARVLNSHRAAFLGARIRSVLHSSISRPEGLYLLLETVNELGTPTIIEEGPGDERTPYPSPSAHAMARPAPEDRCEVADPVDPDDLEEIPPRFMDYIGNLREHGMTSQLKRYPGLEARPWWNARDFAVARDLERMASAIAREIRTVDLACFQSESEAIPRDGSWSVCFLYERGRKRYEHCRLLPITTEIVEAHRTVRTQSGLTYFSRMAPNTLVGAHRGPTNMRLRCHLGIDVPDDCGITVDGITRSWREGECIVFDDSFVHEVWNASNKPRLIFIVDIWHPDLSDDEVALLEGLERHVGHAAEGLHKYWDRNDAAAGQGQNGVPQLGTTGLV